MSRFLKKRLITFIACGGGGGNCLNDMISNGPSSEEYDDSHRFMTPDMCIFFGSDAQSVGASKACYKIQLGNGLGAGAKQDVGRQLAEDNEDKILKTLEQNEAQIFVLLFCAGGGTGSGASPVITKIIRENYPDSILLVFTTLPFRHEGIEKQIIAQNSINQVRENCDGCMVINNEDIAGAVDMKRISFIDALRVINQKLKYYFILLTETIEKYGHMNVDVSDMRTVLKDSRSILMYNVMSPESEISNAMKKMTKEPLHGDWANKMPAGKNLLIAVEDNGASMDTLQKIIEYLKNTYHDPTRGGTVIKGYYPNNDLVCVRTEIALENKLIRPENIHGKEYVLISKKNFARIQTPDTQEGSQNYSNRPDFPQIQGNYFNYRPTETNNGQKWVRIFMILAGVEDREVPEEEEAPRQTNPMNLDQKPPSILVY
jgi:cell division GTPase FtsZ